MGAESKIKINNDGSGEIFFSYRISRMLLEMGDSMDESAEEPQEENDSNVPLPITKEDFEESVEGIEGLEVIDVTETQTEQDVIITAELKFDDVEAVSQAEAFAEWPVTFEKVGNSYVLSQVISEAGNDPETEMDEETISMVESMFEAYEFSFSIETPSPIKEHSIGELSPDKKTVTYTVAVADMLRIKEKMELVIMW
jgi:hypothetical protein